MLCAPLKNVERFLTHNKAKLNQIPKINKIKLHATNAKKNSAP
jgi:hypothetical protein